MWNRVSEKYNSFTNKSNIQDRGGVYYFPNEETGITASSVCVYKDAYGQYQSQGKLKNGKEDGKWTYWYINGQKESEGNYTNNKPEGKQTWWYENGQKEYESNYKDGKQDGKQTLWGENGQIWLESNYKDGWKDGKWTRWLHVSQHSLWF